MIIKDFNLYLRFWHPSIDPNEICSQLQMSTKTKWKAGEQMKTPKGRVLDSIRQHSYCSFKIENKTSKTPTELIENTNNFLMSCKDFLNSFKASGGRSLYIISCCVPDNCGIELNSNLLSNLVTLGIEISLDIYGSKFTNEEN